MSYEIKRDAVLAQFFNQYVAAPIKTTLAQLDAVGNPHLPLSMMLFSVVDFYGKILRVGYDGFPLTVNGVRDYRSFNDSEKNFNFYIERFFPPAHQDKGILIYRIYRCGVLHQIFPKGAALDYFNENERLIVRGRIDGREDYVIPILILFAFKKFVIEALDNQVRLITENDPTITVAVETIYDELLHPVDGLGDFYKRDEILAQFNTSGQSIYDDPNFNVDIRIERR